MNSAVMSSGDSGFLSSGDSSVNGDCASSQASGKFSSHVNTSTAPWGDKSIWGAPLSPTPTFSSLNHSNNLNNNNCNNGHVRDQVWSSQDTNNTSCAASSSSLWEQSEHSANIKKSSSQEWLGSIWMIPQTPKAQMLPNSQMECRGTSPNNYQTFKSEMNSATSSGFQLMRPHDIGNNMWNNTAAAATMSGIKLNSSAASSATTSATTNSNVAHNSARFNQKVMRINALAYGGANQQATNPPPQFNNRPQPAAAAAPVHNNKFDMAQNACLQLFSDDFLNYFNTIH